MSNETYLQTLFSLEGRTAVITGGSGVLGTAMAHGLARAGARVAVVSRRIEACQEVAEAIKAEGGKAIGVACDVTERASLEQALARITGAFGPLDILVNGAGGNQPKATVTPDLPFFELDSQAVENVFGLNFNGTLLTCQVFGRVMAERGRGCIVNIASMASLRPLTRVVAYGAAKAAVVNFTQWLAVHMAQEYGSALRVNAMAPGFFLTEQNRYLLTDAQTGGYTPRGQAILDHTPTGRLGVPDDLVGTLLWLISPAAEFVTGIVVPIDGGFSAFSGV
ncbi:MAG: SDR family oxidoreductase [Ktedonobacteraceae bacterium]|nr:SDR family oxidoreductase [Ktedonobacteraceae bacterium]MBO0789723.1 SDR family oxidoreductase [Ktedonobacteraceae bacterium]